MGGATILGRVFSGLAGQGELFGRLPDGRVGGDACGQGGLIPPGERGRYVVPGKEAGRPGANRA